LAYDKDKKPVILEVIGAGRRTTVAKHGPMHVAPLEFTVMDDGPFATLVDKSGRKWKVQFRNRHGTMLCYYAFCIIPLENLWLLLTSMFCLYRGASYVMLLNDSVGSWS
jgi:hypothetical protein